MRPSMRVISLLFLTTTLSAQNSVDRLDWLSGCWDGSSEKQERLEQWMKPSGNVMLGMNRTVRNGVVREYEFVRIHESNGNIYYTALPSGQAEASFRLIRLDSLEVVFENPEHDFPQRIGYRKEPDGRLVAWIEGKSKGKERKVEFPFRPSSCP